MATTDQGFEINVDDPAFQRARQRLQNTIEGGLGGISEDRLGSFMKGLDGPQMRALVEEFGPQLPEGFMQRAVSNSLAQHKALQDGHSFEYLDNVNRELDDFASLDRDNEGMATRAARGLANVPLWFTQGLQTGSEFVHDMFEDDETRKLNSESGLNQAMDTAGVFGGGLVRQGAKTLWNTGKNLWKSPGKLNPFSKAGRDALSRNKAGIATVAGGGGTGIALGLGGGNPDGMQNIKVNPDGSVGVAPNAPTGTQVPDGFTETGLMRFDYPALPAEQPVGPQQTGGVSLDNPDQAPQTPGTGRINAAQQMPVDKKGKGRFDQQMENTQTELMAEGRRQMNQDIQNQKADDRIAQQARHMDRVMRERALHNARIQNAKDTGIFYDSSEDHRKEVLEALEKSGGSFVDPNDPTNQNKLPGQVSKEEFSKNTGLTQEGTGITQNADGSYATLETGKAFENAGGLDSARPIFNPPAPTGNFSQSNAIQPYRPANADAALANLERQTEGGDKSYRDQYGEGPDLSPDTVRLSSDMADYADAGFQNKEDALNYLNRGAVDIDNPAPTPTYQPEEEDSGSDWWKYATGALATTAALHPATRKWAKNLFTKKQPMKPMQGPMPLGPMQGPMPLKPMQGPQPLGPMQGPPRSNYMRNMNNPWVTARNSRPAPPPMSSEQFQALSRAPHGTSLPEAQVLERIRRQNQRLNAKIF